MFLLVLAISSLTTTASAQYGDSASYCQLHFLNPFHAKGSPTVCEIARIEDHAKGSIMMISYHYNGHEFMTFEGLINDDLLEGYERIGFVDTNVLMIDVRTKVQDEKFPAKYYFSYVNNNFVFLKKEKYRY